MWDRRIYLHHTNPTGGEDRRRYRMAYEFSTFM
jgi:hypothetical protein